MSAAVIICALLAAGVLWAFACGVIVTFIHACEVTARADYSDRARGLSEGAV